MDASKARKIGYSTILSNEDAEDVIRLFRNDNKNLKPAELLWCDYLFIDQISKKSGARPELQKLLDFLRPQDDVYFNKVSDISFRIKDIYAVLNHIKTLRCAFHFVDYEANDLFLSFYQGVGFIKAVIRLEEILEKEFELMNSLNYIIKPVKYVKRGRPSKINPELVRQLVCGDQNISPDGLCEKFGIKRSRAYSLIKEINLLRKDMKNVSNMTSLGEREAGKSLK